MSIGDTERATQDRVVSFFKDRDILDYEYVRLSDTNSKHLLYAVLCISDIE